MRMLGEGGDRGRLTGTSLLELAERIRAPVLLVHGEYDRRVDADHSRRLSKRLTSDGGELLILPEDGEGPWRQVSRLHFYERLEAFLQRHLAAPAAEPRSAR